MARYHIKNAMVVTMDEKLGVLYDCDVLIEEGAIKAVGSKLDGSGAEVIDGSDCIVSPGFVDTHRHMWQTQLAGLMSDHTLLEYFGHVRSVYGSCYTARDAYLGNYVGALQCLDNGTTFIIDHSHIMNSANHSDSAVQGLLDSHIRGVFCYGFFINNVPVWREDDTGIQPPSDPDWRLADSKRVKDKFFAKNGPSEVLRFGIAPFELEVQPIEQAVREIEHARSIEAATITGHAALGKHDFGVQIVEKLKQKNLLKSDMLFSHTAALTPSEYAAVKECDCGLAVTPDTELQMAMGPPGAFKARSHGVSRVGLGTDVSCSNPPDMFTQMRLLLQSERQTRSLLHENGPPREVPIKCKEVLEFATIGGARAAGREKYIGSITPGKRADLIITSCKSTRMSPVSDPIAALVMYANASDVDTVMVDGRILKRGGELVGVDWLETRKELLASTKAIRERAKDAPFDAIMEHVYG
ncbi:5'-deoxyadenosine deaminase [Cyphellophora attinorum]|uniref:5'-deoxyadenosine deaminase n=1 Tax=Cyphellophora attinorum TaxID=1664694 RepID=A0A0N0NLP9_9EURO|nr:5'-deoxyadenosine deaminase [Phialophora attinorum]KPI39289.1 5'-deoxyadenosine deaminase [Phialophora attinorum]